MSSIPQEETQQTSPEKSLSATRRGLKVELPHHSYRIDISSHDNSPLCDYLAQQCADKRPLVLTTSVVGPLLMPDLLRGFRARRLKAPYLILPDGERFKTLQTVEMCYDWLLEQQADRQSVLVILGGGVIGDIGGFAAATYMRGIRYVQVPTTLVSQVDSSVGGKVGVDHKEGKNLIGAFYQPQYVHIDVGYLEKLPEREYLCGLAEVIKYAVISDADLFEYLQRNRIEILRRNVQNLEHIVETCCHIKADVVEQDEKEMSGLRMILNFGHSVGHAIERLTEYKKYGHGEAVAIGMIAATKLSQRKGYCSPQTAQQINDMVASYGLPTKIPRFTTRQWQQSLRYDKKMRGKELHFVFVEKVGAVRVEAIDPKDAVKEITA